MRTPKEYQKHIKNNEITEKMISDAQVLIESGNISYLYSFEGDSLNDKAQSIAATIPTIA